MRPCPHPIGALLPQQPPMILLDEVLRYDETALVAAVTIREATLFRSEDGVPVHVGIEYMAQACGAHVGALALDAGLPVKIGFLLGTRRYHGLKSWFLLGHRLEVAVTAAYSDDEMAAYDCRIDDEDELAATAQLTLYRPRDPEDFIAQAMSHD
jgi:predicted hotdog family 3-hydroxylacyl-ACP dehydratase